MPIRINGVPLLDDEGQLRFQFRLLRGAVVRGSQPAAPASLSHETSGQPFSEPGTGPTTTDRSTQARSRLP